MQEDYFGEAVAAGYDDGGPMFGAGVIGPTVDFLYELAGDGAALELGIGTGRVAVFRHRAPPINPIAAPGVAQPDSIAAHADGRCAGRRRQSFAGRP